MYYILIILLPILFERITSTDVIPKTILLNDGNKIPIVSFGTIGRTRDMTLVKPAVIQAIEAGYRQLDTAQLYQNEAVVGEAIADVISRGIVTREELWITTKLNFFATKKEDVVPAIKAALKRLQLSYIDLYLIHTRHNSMEILDYVNIWKGMEDAKRLNLTRSIGVSNLLSGDINNILVNSETRPSVNEIEVSISFTNLDLVAYCQSQNITVLSYAPFGFMVPRPFVNNPVTISFEDPVLMEIAKKYGKTTSQVVLRYLMDRGTIPIPRSTNIEHIKLNIDLFDFNLTQEEIYIINEFNGDAKVYNFDIKSLLIAKEYFEL